MAGFLEVPSGPLCCNNAWFSLPSSQRSSKLDLFSPAPQANSCMNLISRRCTGFAFITSSMNPRRVTSLDTSANGALEDEEWDKVHFMFGQLHKHRPECYQGETFWRSGFESQLILAGSPFFPCRTLIRMHFDGHFSVDHFSPRELIICKENTSRRNNFDGLALPTFRWFRWTSHHYMRVNMKEWMLSVKI